MPLLKPPEPPSPMRKFYLRIEEPLAQTMERYAEFLGTTSIDHVVTEALQFIFKRDNQFKSWLEQNPEPTPKPASQRARSKNTAPNGAPNDPACACLQGHRCLRPRLCHRNHPLLPLALSRERPHAALDLNPRSLIYAVSSTPIRCSCSPLPTLPTRLFFLASTSSPFAPPAK